MKIERFDRDLGSTEVAQAFLTRQIHLVCLACNGLTDYNAFVCGTGGMDGVTAGQYCDRVNQANEVGTLYPAFNMTIIPQKMLDNQDDLNNRFIIKQHIRDCFRANEDNIRCSLLVFSVCGNSGINFDLFLDILSKEAGLFKFVYTNRICYT